MQLTYDKFTISGTSQELADFLFTYETKVMLKDAGSQTQVQDQTQVQAQQTEQPQDSNTVAPL